MSNFLLPSTGSVAGKEGGSEGYKLSSPVKAFFSTPKHCLISLNEIMPFLGAGNHGAHNALTPVRSRLPSC